MRQAVRVALRLMPAIAAFGAQTGCGPEPTHPPEASICPDQSPCSPSINSVRGPQPSDTGGGEGGASGQEAELTGRVLEVLTDSFSASAVHTEPAWIEVVGASGRVVRTDWDGKTSFVLGGFERNRSTWFSVRPQSGAAWLRTLQLVDTVRYDASDLLLVASDVLSTAFSLVTVPVTPEPNAGHALLVFYAGASPKAGVQVSILGADVVAYASAGTWSRDEDRTDGSGAVLVGNVPAASFPGTQIEARLSGSLTGSVTFPAAREALSLVRVQTE